MWCRRIINGSRAFVVANAVVDVLEGLKLKYPKLSGDEKAALAQARRQLENE